MSKERLTKDDVLELIRRFRVDRAKHEAAGEDKQVLFYDALIETMIAELGPDYFPPKGNA